MKIIANNDFLSLTKGKEYEVIREFKQSYKIKADSGYLLSYYKKYFDIVDETPSHYDNTKGSLYQFAEQQKLNSWEFDIIKRIVRSRKKGNFIEDLEKTKVVIDLYLKEYDQSRNNK